MRTLYTYFRSSASFRVRIVLNLKGLRADHEAVHLVRNGGEQLGLAYRAVNPDGVVPTLVETASEGAKHIVTQSMAIIEYLDEVYPNPPLLPTNPFDRAFVRSTAAQIACEIHPVNNLRVLKQLSFQFHADQEQKALWYRHWIDLGFESLEARLSNDPRVGTYVFGDVPGLADAFLVPQVWNARRFDIPLDRYPTIVRLADHALSHPAFANAAPAAQPDAE